MTMQDRYLIELFWSDEDGGFIAIAPDLPGCSAFGDTATEAIAEMQNAVAAWLEACHNMHREPPEAKARARYVA